MASPKVCVVIAGGTIGMRYDDKQQGLVPALTGEELLKTIQLPYPIETHILDWSRQPSGHYTAQMMLDLVKELDKLAKSKENYDGFVVTFGTDIMEEITYLTNLLWTHKQPVVFTGAIHALDYVGSDGPKNLSDAITVAASSQLEGMGAVLVFAGEIHSAKDVIKQHTTHICAFASPQIGPMGEVLRGRITIFYKPFRKPVISDMSEIKQLELKVELIKATGGATDLLISKCIEAQSKGIVIEAFGCGNIPPNWIPYIKKAIKEDIAIVITSRCQKGGIWPIYGYEGGSKKVLELGVIPSNLSGQKARIKLMVALGLGIKDTKLYEFIREE